MTRAFAALLALTSACSTLPVAEPRYEGAYGLSLAKATRKAMLYSGLETRALVHATWLSPEFITAQAAELSRLRGEPPTVAQARLARMLAENKSPSFFVALHTPQKEWNDWQEPSSIWRIAVDLGKGQIDKPKVTRIERPDSETLTLYPYLDVFSIGYVLHFEGDPQPTLGETLAAGSIHSALGQIELIASGVLGQLRREWVLRGLSQK